MISLDFVSNDFVSSANPARGLHLGVAPHHIYTSHRSRYLWTMMIGELWRRTTKSYVQLSHMLLLMISLDFVSNDDLARGLHAALMSSIAADHPRAISAPIASVPNPDVSHRSSGLFLSLW